jgi:hypothetical protein
MASYFPKNLGSPAGPDWFPGIHRRKQLSRCPLVGRQRPGWMATGLAIAAGALPVLPSIHGKGATHLELRRAL